MPYGAGGVRLLPSPHGVNVFLAVGATDFINNAETFDSILSMSCTIEGKCANWTPIGRIEKGRSLHVAMWVPSSITHC